MKINVSLNRNKVLSALSQLNRKELFMALYFMCFILGMVNFSKGYGFYSEYRIFEVALLLIITTCAVLKEQYRIDKNECKYKTRNCSINNGCKNC